MRLPRRRTHDLRRVIHHLPSINSLCTYFYMILRRWTEQGREFILQKEEQQQVIMNFLSAEKLCVLFINLSPHLLDSFPFNHDKYSCFSLQMMPVKQGSFYLANKCNRTTQLFIYLNGMLTEDGRNDADYMCTNENSWHYELS